MSFDPPKAPSSEEGSDQSSLEKPAMELFQPLQNKDPTPSHSTEGPVSLGTSASFPVLPAMNPALYQH